ncbi:UvrD-helicase domain-containing protein, partial [Micromonospora fiedleri]
MHPLFDIPVSSPAPEPPPRRVAAPGRPDPLQLVEGLNGPQRDAVTHAGSPLLIVAGAGSGKTRVLTHRLPYLPAARDVHPGQIIAIPFPNKPPGQMTDRVAKPTP